MAGWSRVRDDTDNHECTVKYVAMSLSNIDPDKPSGPFINTDPFLSSSILHVPSLSQSLLHIVTKIHFRKEDQLAKHGNATVYKCVTVAISWGNSVTTQSVFQNDNDTQCMDVYVTKFSKTGLIHASDFSTLRRCNSASVGPTALKFGRGTLLS